MGWDTGLADRLRAKGVRVVEVDGWRTRGSTTYTPDLGIWHHTAGAASGSAPSLAVCIYGRPGLSGPLCQVLQSRDPDGNDIAYVIAAGRANHAGVGTWRGISGNSRAFGVEVEHTGTTVQPGVRHEITARIIAAGLEGGSRDARNVCRHAEYATPAGRKIDFNIAAEPWTADDMRARVGYWIGREDDDVTPEQMNQLVERTAQRVLERINDAYGKRGSVIRTKTRELAKLGADDALKAREGVDPDPVEPPAG